MADHDDWEPLSESEMKLMQARRERSDKISKLMGDYLLKGYKMLASTCLECETILLQDRQGTNYCVACSELDTDTGKDDPVISQCAAMSMAREMELASSAASGAGLTAAGASATSPSSEQLSKRSQPTVSFTETPSCTTGNQRVMFVPESTTTTTSLSMTSIDVQCWPANPTDLRSSQTLGGAMIKGDLTSPDSGLSLSGPVSQSSSSSVLKKGLSPTLEQPQAVSSLSQTTNEALLSKIQWATSELRGTHSVEYSIQLCHLIKAASDAITAVRTARI